MHRRHAPSLLAAALAAALLTPPAAVADERDPRAVEIAHKLMDTLGGQEALDAVHFLRFSFAGFRTHHWDRWTGRHRVEWQSREGDRFLVLHNIQSREGKAYRGGEGGAWEEATGEEAQKLLDGAYGAWINDTYWLLFPFKTLDPGVNLTYAGEETLDGKTYDKLKLTFGDVGLTPGDTYWAYVNRETGLLDRWAFVLQSYEPGQEATHWQWSDWQRHGGILLAAARSQVGGERQLPMKDLAVFDELPDSVFESPQPVATAPTD